MTKKEFHNYPDVALETIICQKSDLIRYHGDESEQDLIRRHGNLIWFVFPWKTSSESTGVFFPAAAGYF